MLTKDEGVPTTITLERPRPPFFWFSLICSTAVIVLMIAQGFFAYRYGAQRRDRGWTVEQRGAAWLVKAVRPDGPAAGTLLPGDQILAVNGDTRLGRIGPDWRLDDAPIDRPYRLTIQRDSHILEPELHFTLRHAPRYLLWTAMEFVIAIVFLSVGLLLAWKQPWQKVAQYAFCNSLLAVVFWMFVVTRESGTLPSSGIRTLLLLGCVTPWHLMFGYYFWLWFPKRFPVTRLWRHVTALLTALGVVFWVIRAGTQFIRGLSPEPRIAFLFKHWNWIRSYIYGLEPLLRAAVPALVMLATIALIVRNYRALAEGDQRRRIRWVVSGAALALMPLVVLSLLTLFIERARLETAIKTFNLLVVVGPITLAYAIIKHRVLDISVALRLGLQYLLAKNVLRAVLILPLLLFAMTVIANPQKTVGELLFFGSGPLNLLLVAAAIVGLKYRGRLMLAIDQRFFREAYNQEQILRALIESLKSMDSPAEISRCICAEVTRALHPLTMCTVFQDPRQPESSAGYSSDGNALKVSASCAAALLVCVGDSQTAVDWHSSRQRLLPEDRQWLTSLQLTLIVPVVGSTHKPVGLLLLGEKRSEEPYSATDRSLLLAVAGQAAVVYENLVLRERVFAERKIRHEVLTRFEEQNINLVKECPRCMACYDSSSQVCDRDGQELVLSLPVERLVDGKYRLESVIGRGGMGCVYRAKDLRLNREVAVKVMMGSLFGNAAALRRFEREARASAGLEHPNIVRLYDFGGLRGEGAYLVLELARGTSWRAELNRVGVIPPAEAAELMDQLLAGMEFAHQAHIIHRDLKPENIMLVAHDAAESAPSQVKILDFGLAKIRQLDPGHSGSLTELGAVLGTMGYMSPEQFNGEEVDERTDIFALGVIAAETVLGRWWTQKPVHPQMMGGLLQRRLSGETILPQQAELRETLALCLEPDYRQRISSVRRLRQELIPRLRACPPFYLTQAQTAADGPQTNVSQTVE